MEMLRSFFRDEEGANLIEYALLVSLIALAVVATAGLLGNNLNTWFSKTNSMVADWTTK